MTTTFADDIYNKIATRFKDIEMAKGDRTIATLPRDAVFFAFNFSFKGKEYGSITISIVNDGEINLYVSSEITKAVNKDKQAQNHFHKFLKEISRYAGTNGLLYKVHNINKQHMDKKDYERLATENKPEEEITMESKMRGSKKRSYQESGGARIIVQHKKAIDEERVGARSRRNNINAIFIENKAGERFRFENNYLPGARAMAKHIGSGGYQNDQFGGHISEMMNEMAELGQFVRKARADKYVSEAAKEIIESSRERYKNLHETIKKLSTTRGYNNYFENFDPALVEVNDNDISSIREKLTRDVFDERLEQSLGAVGKAMKLQEKKQGEFYDFAMWQRSAKSAGATIEGDVTNAVAMKDNREIGSWEQTEEDLTGTKINSSIKDPGYGEINMGAGDRADTERDEFEVPQVIDLMPGESELSSLRTNDKNALLAAILREISWRSNDDTVANFASEMSETIASVGTTFGQREDDADFANKKAKAIQLANVYLKQIKTGANEDVDNMATVKITRFDESVSIINSDTFNNWNRHEQSFLKKMDDLVQSGKMHDAVSEIKQVLKNPGHQTDGFLDELTIIGQRLLGDHGGDIHADEGCKHKKVKEEYESDDVYGIVKGRAGRPGQNKIIAKLQKIFFGSKDNGVGFNKNYTRNMLKNAGYNDADASEIEGVYANAMKVAYKKVHGEAPPRDKGNWGGQIGKLGDDRTTDLTNRLFKMELAKMDLTPGEVSHPAYGRTHESVNEGTWSVPDTPEAVNDLRKLLTQELPVGRNAENASSALYDLIGDDELFDELDVIGSMNPEADVRNAIKNWIKDNIDRYNISDDIKQELLAIATVNDWEEDNDKTEESADLTRMREIAGINSGKRSNFAINEGEEGYSGRKGSSILREFANKIK